MRAWKSVVEALVAEKSEFVFGLAAGPWEFWDYLSETDTKPIAVWHDASAVFMTMALVRQLVRWGPRRWSPRKGGAATWAKGARDGRTLGAAFIAQFLTSMSQFE